MGGHLRHEAAAVAPRRGYYGTAEDNYNSAYVGAFEGTLSYGTTTIVDYCQANIHGPGWCRRLDQSALRETGIRHLFEHSFMPGPPGDTFKTLDERFAEGAARLRGLSMIPSSLTSIGFGVDSIGGSPDIARASSPFHASTRR